MKCGLRLLEAGKVISPGDKIEREWDNVGTN
jgi:hypothetical protein